jgi:hypothetical protein
MGLLSVQEHFNTIKYPTPKSFAQAKTGQQPYRRAVLPQHLPETKVGYPSDMSYDWRQ